MLGCGYRFWWKALLTKKIRQRFLPQKFPATVIRNIYVVTWKTTKTNGTLHGAYMERISNERKYCYTKISNVKYLRTKIKRITVYSVTYTVNMSGSPVESTSIRSPTFIMAILSLTVIFS